MTATTVIISILSPILIALIRRQQWSREIIALFSIFAVTCLYICGKAFDQSLNWPLTGEFWEGLLAALGTSQVSYEVIRSAFPGTLAKVEDV